MQITMEIIATTIIKIAVTMKRMPITNNFKMNRKILILTPI